MLALMEAARGLLRGLGTRTGLFAGLAGALAVAVLVGVLAMELKSPRYVPLFSELDSRDAGDIVKKLDEQGIPYRLTSGGSAISVPEPVVHRTRLSLAQEGLPRSGVVGLEIMDKFSLGATEFDKRVQYLRAIQGELTRTIMQIEGVKEARVHLNIPEPSLFVRDERPATASILLKLRPGVTLDPSKVRGITHLVAGSVEGLKPGGVTVLNDGGTLLSGETGGEGDAFGVHPSQNLLVQQNFQQQLEKSLQTLLEQVLGPGNVAARVTAEMNFDQQTVEKELFEPINENQGIERSMQELTETFRGAGVAGGGVPGTASNLDVPVYPTTEGANSEYEKSSVTRTFEINKTRQIVTVAPGAVKRLSVSVVVDRELTGGQSDMISALVSAAVGYDPDRKDQISVIGLPFDTSLADGLKGAAGSEAGASGEKKSSLVTYLIYAGAGVGVIGAFVTAFLLARRKASKEKERLALELMELQRQSAREAAAAKSVREPSLEMAAAASLQGQVSSLARQKPDEVAQIIRSWLQEE